MLSFPVGSSTTGHDLILGSTSGGATVNLTNTGSDGFFNIHPDFSPDGTKLAFVRKSTLNGTTDLFLINTDGTGLTQLTDTPNFSEGNPSWSPDGTRLVFHGIHTPGNESDSPALEPGETANANIYILTLPPANIVTPKTTLTDPPLITIEEQNVTFTFAPFLKAQQKPATAKRSITEGRIETRAKKPKARFSFRYQLVVTKQGAGKKRVVKRFSKRSTLTLKNVLPGDYTAKYRVEITKKVGSVTTVSRTRFSPSAAYTVN